VFPTLDGHINIAASGQHIFARMCKAMGAERLLEDPDFATGEKRSENRARLNAEIGGFTKTYTSLDLVERLNAAGVPSGPIYDIGQMFADPQVKHVGMAVPMPHPTRKEAAVVNQAVELSRTPALINRPTPGLGEHSADILAGLGYSSNDIAALRSKKVI
jgi:formyl-CoA transferase